MTATRQHGTRACYVHGCRRPECSAANNRYCKKYTLTTLTGPIRIDSEPLAVFFDGLAEKGYSNRQIAAAAGRHDAEISKIRTRRQPTVHPDVANAYYRLDLSGIQPSLAMTDATGTIRRARALCVIGHPLYRIARAVPMSKNLLGTVLTEEPPAVRVVVADGMKCAYREMIRRPGTSVKSRCSAARSGWHGPLAWDDTSIDDPDATPEGEPAEAALKRDQLAAIRRAEVEHLARFGISNGEIKKRVDLSASAIAAIVHELHTGQRRDRSTAAA